MTKFFLAGAEASSLSNLLEDCGCKYILYSFWHMLNHKWTKALTERVLRGRDEGRRYLLDSGAFSLQEGAVVQDEPVEIDRYVELYFEYVQRYGHLFDACAELDIEGRAVPGRTEPISWDEMTLWRHEMLELNPQARVMPIWHPETRTRGEWSDVCRDPRFPYLGIGGQAALKNDRNVGLYMALIAEAHRHGKLVHGYGATKIRTQLNRLYYDSVDSSSWVAAQKYGTTYIFRSGQWVVLDKYQKEERRRYKQHFIKKGINWQELEDDKARALRHAAVVAWRDVGAWFEKKRAIHEKRLAEKVQNALDTLPQDTDDDMAILRKTPGSKNEPKTAPDKETTPTTPPNTARRRQRQRRYATPSLEAPKMPTWEELAGEESEDFTQSTPEILDPRAYAQDMPASTRVEDVKEFAQPPQYVAAPAQTHPLSPLNDPKGSDLHLNDDFKGNSEQELDQPSHLQPVYVRNLETQQAKLREMPTLSCARCAFSDTCPVFDETRPFCAYEKDMEETFNMRSSENMLGLMEHIVNDNKKRWMRARLSEELSEGGLPNDRTTQLSQLVIKQVQDLRAEREYLDGEKPRAAEGGGILKELFASITQTTEAKVGLKKG